jgi:Polyketide cyclase / dehydrase and lipid transport
VTTENISSTKVINASADTIFAILADPSKHAAIDGTGWVRESLDGQPLTRQGQVFRVAMYHDNHPNKDYEMANRIEDFDPPRTISWKPGQDLAGDGNLEFGGWIWRYDLAPIGPTQTEVTLTYDWSAVPQQIRDHIGFPPFAVDHLDNSLDHLAQLAAASGS